MKKIFIMTVVISAICLKGFSQKLKESEVPSAVKASFEKIYPGISAKWEKEKGNYEAEFKKDGKSMSTLIEPSGTMLETEISIKESELPAAAKSYLKTNYKDRHIKGTAKITGSDGGVTFEAEIDGKDVIFDSTGKFLKEVKE